METEIEELLKSAKEKSKHWHKLTNKPKPNRKTWQQMLDRPYGRMESKY